MSSSNGPQTFSREIVEILFRHKILLVVFPLLIFAMAAAVLTYAPRTYRSEAKLYLQIGRASVGLDPTATTGQTINYSQSGRDEEVKSAMEIILSIGVIGKVVDKLGVDVANGSVGSPTEPASSFVQNVKQSIGAMLSIVKRLDPISDREQVILDIQEALTVNAERESTVLVLKYDAPSPQLAQITLAALVEVYQQEHSRIHRHQDSLDFFDEQKLILQKQLDGSVNALRDAKNQMNISSLIGRRQTLESQMKDVQLEQIQTVQNISSAEARMNIIGKQLLKMPERLVASRKSVPNSGADLMRDQLYELQLKQKELIARYTPDFPQVKAIAKQIDEAKMIVTSEKETRDETSDVINPVHQQLFLEYTQQESALAGLESRLKTAEAQMEKLHYEMKELNQFEVRLDQLERESQLNREKFMKYAQNVEEARIDQQLSDQRISDVSIVQDASLSEKPVSPSKTLIALAAVLLSTGGTGALIFLSEKMDSRIRGGHELQFALGLPVLGVLPESPIYRRVQVKQ